MIRSLSTPCTVFVGDRLLCAGPLIEVALAIKDAPEALGPAAILTFEDATGRPVDLDLRGTKEDIAARLAASCSGSVSSTDGQAADAPAEPSEPVATPRVKGRPKLGVIAREVTLLPRHWAWLSEQPGGASVTMRKLVEEARRSGAAKQHQAAAHEAAYRFMSALAGNYPGYEAAIRLLFADDRAGFEARIAAWPVDVAAYATRLAFDRPMP